MVVPTPAPSPAGAPSDVEAFLRTINLPLSNLDAIVAALPHAGVSMAQLRVIAAQAAALLDKRNMMPLLASAASALGVASEVERVLVASALLSLVGGGPG